MITGKGTAQMSMMGLKYKSTVSDYKDPSKGQYEHVNEVDVNDPDSADSVWR